MSMKFSFLYIWMKEIVHLWIFHQQYNKIERITRRKMGIIQLLRVIEVNGFCVLLLAAIVIDEAHIVGLVGWDTFWLLFFHRDTNLNNSHLGLWAAIVEICVFLHTFLLIFLVILSIKLYWFRWRGLPWRIHKNKWMRW